MLYNEHEAEQVNVAMYEFNAEVLKRYIKLSPFKPKKFGPYSAYVNSMSSNSFPSLLFLDIFRRGFTYKARKEVSEADRFIKAKKVICDFVSAEPLRPGEQEDLLEALEDVCKLSSSCEEGMKSWEVFYCANDFYEHHTYNHAYWWRRIPYKMLHLLVLSVYATFGDIYFNGSDIVIGNYPQLVQEEELILKTFVYSVLFLRSLITPGKNKESTRVEYLKNIDSISETINYFRYTMFSRTTYPSDYLTFVALLSGDKILLDYLKEKDFYIQPHRLATSFSMYVDKYRSYTFIVNLMRLAEDGHPFANIAMFFYCYSLVIILQSGSSGEVLLDKAHGVYMWGLVSDGSDFELVSCSPEARQNLLGLATKYLVAAAASNEKCFIAEMCLDLYSASERHITSIRPGSFKNLIIQLINDKHTFSELNKLCHKNLIQPFDGVDFLSELESLSIDALISNNDQVLYEHLINLFESQKEKYVYEAIKKLCDQSEEKLMVADAIFRCCIKLPIKQEKVQDLINVGGYLGNLIWNIDDSSPHYGLNKECYTYYFPRYEVDMEKHGGVPDESLKKNAYAARMNFFREKKMLDTVGDDELELELKESFTNISTQLSLLTTGG